jgi:hypothetical protein
VTEIFGSPFLVTKLFQSQSKLYFAATVQPHISPGLIGNRIKSNASKNTDWVKILNISALF